MKFWKYSGILLIVTGIIHTVVALALGWNDLSQIVKDGFINAVGDDLAHNMAFWFLVCGVVIIFYGQTLHYYIKKTQKPAPLSLGWSLLFFSIIGCIMIPVSGFWLFLPQALIIILANRKQVQ